MENFLQIFEQIESALRDIAPILSNYKKYLKEQGFTEAQAFQLVRDYQITLFQKGDTNS